ncbi:MAG: hypothetical protein JO022_08760 [Acidobacteriaceae bacterium]|nr:hypothetical protein [Acidobacteriaceae bacterium]
MSIMKRLRLAVLLAIAVARSTVAAEPPRMLAKPAEANAVWTSGTYAYDGSADIITIGADTYRYDLDGRLVLAAIQTPTTITQQFVYDALGNLTSVDNTPGVDLSIPVNPATNQVNNGASTGNVASAVYDEAGNQTQRNADSYVYTYDGTAMVTRLIASSRNERYLYDADDQRIAYVNSNASGYRWRYTVRDADGRFVREYTDDVAGTQHTWHWTQDYVYASSRLVGSFLATGTVEARRNFHLDHLGTPRLTTAADGTVLSQQKLLPFGEEAPGSTADKSQTVRFTGHERDYASGSDENDLDYMHARYYAPKMGRFLSVDPVVNMKESVSTPQLWNRYAYAVNNPAQRVDLDGRWATWIFRVHQAAIDTSLSFVDESRREVLRSAQERVDIDQMNQYKHACRLPGQPVEEARAKAQAFVDTSMEKAIEHELKGDTEMAMEHLGAAIHTLQDATSPTHAGYQVFDPSWSVRSRQMRDHVVPELHDPGVSFGTGRSMNDVTFRAWVYFANRVGLPVPNTPLSNTAPDPSSHTLIEVP